MSVWKSRAGTNPYIPAFCWFVTQNAVVTSSQMLLALLQRYTHLNWLNFCQVDCPILYDSTTCTPARCHIVRTVSVNVRVHFNPNKHSYRISIISFDKCDNVSMYEAAVRSYRLMDKRKHLLLSSTCTTSATTRSPTQHQDFVAS